MSGRRGKRPSWEAISRSVAWCFILKSGGRLCRSFEGASHVQQTATGRCTVVLYLVQIDCLTRWGTVGVFLAHRLRKHLSTYLTNISLTKPDISLVINGPGADLLAYSSTISAYTAWRTQVIDDFFITFTSIFTPDYVARPGSTFT